MQNLKRIVATVTLMLVLAGCGLLNDDATDQDLASPGGSDSAQADSVPDDAEVAGMLASLERCRATAPVLAGAVWLGTGIMPEEVAGLDQLLAAAPAIADHRYVDEEDTYREFTEYFADEPEIVELVDPDQLPTSFKIRFADGEDTAAVVDKITQLAAVDEVELEPNDDACRAEADAMQVLCDQPPRNLLIWVRPSASPAAVDAVSSALVGSALVDGFSYEDVEQTYEEFVSFYGEGSEIVSLIDPEQLPTSFKVDFVPLDEPVEDRSAAVETLRSTLESLEAVDNVEEGPVQLLATCRIAGLDDADSPVGD